MQNQPRMRSSQATAAAVSDSWVAEAKQRDWVKTIRPWAVFAGLTDKRPVSVPSTVELELRGQCMRLLCPCVLHPWHSAAEATCGRDPLHW